jgi:hypothetical protein
VIYLLFTLSSSHIHSCNPPSLPRLKSQDSEPSTALFLKTSARTCPWNSRLLGLLLEQVDESVGAAVVLADLTLALKLTKNALGELLAELDAPLVVRVDVPDGALDEGEVLVVGDQGTESAGGDLLCQDGSGGPVAEESLVGDELVGGALGLDGFRGLADHEGLGLGEEVGGEHALVLVVVDGVVGLGGEDEVGGDELGALVEELEEGVLGVGAGLAEEDGAGGVLDIVSAAGDSLAVGFHGELLKVGGEAVHVLVVAVKGLLVIVDREKCLEQKLTERPSESGHRRSQSTRR